MRIAINTRFLLPNKMEGFGWYTYEIVSRMVKNHPEHEFIFFFDRPFDEKFIFADNVTPVVLSPQARHPFLFYLWFEFAIKRALKKYKADLFFSPDGYLSLSSKIKQVAVIHDINFEHNPKDVGWLVRKYLKSFFPKFARKAEHIITVSNYSKTDIVKSYNIHDSKITSIWNGASNEFKQISEKEKRSVQVKYSNGKPYFLFVGALSPRKNLKRLIKAFDTFKTDNPRSDYQLVIVGEELWKNSSSDIEISDNIKNQIHFTGHVALKELALIMGGASIFTFISYFEGFGIPLVEAMKCGTPILSGDRTSLPEIADDAALYCNPFNVEEITEKLNELASNVNLQNELSLKGIERSKLFSWDKAADQTWDVINSILLKD